jgi:hypothetical protein
VGGGRRWDTGAHASSNHRGRGIAFDSIRDALIVSLI